MLLNLLRINTNGVNPLKLDCWVEEPEPVRTSEASPFIISTPKSYTKVQPPRGLKSKGKGVAPASVKRAEKIENPSYYWDTPSKIQPTQDILLGNQSPAALHGLIALKTWQARYGEHLRQGEDMFAKDLYSLALIHPIAGLAKVFEYHRAGAK